MGLRARVHRILEVGAGDNPVSQAFDLALLGLIAVNVVAFVLETEPAIHAAAPLAFELLEQVSLWIFAVEYALRVWCCVENPRFRGRAGRLRFVATPLAIVDLIAIMPLLANLSGLDTRFVRVLRLLRIFRIAKLLRYSESLQALGRVFASKRGEMLALVFVLGVLLVLASSLMYLVESRVAGSKFHSIPEAMWWGIITLTTVGYGDATPITPLGKLLAGAIAVLGIGMFALPTSILGAAFVDELQERRAHRRTRRGAGAGRCPHCGRPF